MNNFKQVSEEQFYIFAEKRHSETGKDIVRDVNQMSEPPLMTLNDFSTGLNYPESRVAYAKLYDGSEYHGFKSVEYFIREDEFLKYLSKLSGE